MADAANIFAVCIPSYYDRQVALSIEQHNYFMQNSIKKKRSVEGEMLNWLRGNTYRQQVLDTVSLLLIDESGAMRRSLIRDYPGIEGAIKAGQERKQNKNELAIIIVQAVLAATIEQTQDRDRLRRIADSLCAWVERNGIETFKQELSEGSLMNTDGFELRLRAALSFIGEMQEDKRVEGDMCQRFLKEMVGALDGLDAEERERRRYVDVFDNIRATLRAGADDDSGLVPINYAMPLKQEFSGIEDEVRVVSTPQGLVMRKADDGSAITDRRTLTQEDLRQVPRDAEKLIFVNLHAHSGEIYSCIIAEPKNEVFGDQRAAWWSLAKAIVRVAEAKAKGVRMTEMAYAHVSAVARAVWNSAIEQTPIEHMRDQLMQMRHIHFEVINAGMASAENEAQQLGREIALAMVMAVQSEDEKLERFAFNSFKRFIWVSGEEPREFWHHEHG